MKGKANKKSRKRRAAKSKNGALALRLIKCALFGCVLTVILVLAFALLLKWNLIQESGISIATSTVKALCAVFVGVLCANGMEQRGWLLAGIGGCAYILIAFLAFSLVEKVFAVNLGLLADLGMGFIAGVAGSMLLRLKKA